MDHHPLAEGAKYVLLVGSATYDPKNYMGKGNLDLVPTKLIDTSVMETASNGGWWTSTTMDSSMAMAACLPARYPRPSPRSIRSSVVGEHEQQSAVLVADTPHVDDAVDFAQTSDALASVFPLLEHRGAQGVSRNRRR